MRVQGFTRWFTLRQDETCDECKLAIPCGSLCVQTVIAIGKFPHEFFYDHEGCAESLPSERRPQAKE